MTKTGKCDEADKTASRCNGFLFTKADEKAMRKAMEESVAYMSRYGKGTRKPMIDKSHYITYQHKV